MRDVEDDFHTVDIRLVIVLLLFEPESINTHIAALDQVAGTQVQTAGVGIGIAPMIYLAEIGPDLIY